MEILKKVQMLGDPSKFSWAQAFSDKTGYIYKITNPNGLVYIGQTTRLKRRKNLYKKLGCQDQPALYNSLLKYDWDNHKFEVIDQTFLVGSNNFLLDLYEIYWISYYNSYNNGLNCTKGGLGGSPFKGHKHTEKSKLKISNTAKLTYTEERKQLAIKLHTRNTYNKGRVHTLEHNKKISESGKGKHNSLGYKHTLEVRQRMSDSNHLKVKIKCIETNIIYKSQTDCAIQLNLNVNSFTHRIAKNRRLGTPLIFKHLHFEIITD
jgi:group I intron endonuclease